MMRLLMQPSGYRGNPGGYAMNQAGHALLGALWVAGGLPIWAWIAGYLAWEAAQLWLFDASLWDCLEDACFALGGALAVATGWPVAAILIGFLAVGIARRIQERASV